MSKTLEEANDALHEAKVVYRFAQKLANQALLDLILAQEELDKIACDETEGEAREEIH